MEWFGTRIEYALMAVIHLARRYGREKPVKMSHMAAQTGAPPKYLVHILLRLKEAALVNTKRGPAGGYWLVRPPHTISMAEVVSAVEPESEASAGSPGNDSPEARAIRGVWQQLEAQRWETLRQISLAHLLDRVNELENRS